MASISFSLDRGADQSPDAIAIGTKAVSGASLEVRIDNAIGITRTEAALMLDAIKREILDGRQAVFAEV